MKILKITLQNIHSLKGLHKIDFTNGPLSKTGLFAITGPTGSGKSTLLDAITLALFNQTPRTGSLSKAAIERLGAVITRNTDEAFAEIEFETKNKIYRSKWLISRARTGNLRDYDMHISSRNDHGDFIPLDYKKGDVPAKNAEIIGLNYDQFVKSILLSQGEFARFLKADPKERSELLEKITGTGIYRAIGKAAYEKQKEERLKLEQIQQKLADVKILSGEEILNFTLQLATLDEESKQANQEREVCGEGIKTKKDLKLKSETAVKLNERLRLLSIEEEKLTSEKDRLTLHRLLLPLKSDLDRLIMLQNRKVKSENESENLKKQTAKLNEELELEKISLTQKISAKETVKSTLIAQKPLFEAVQKLDKEIDASKTRATELKARLGLINPELIKEIKELDDARKTLAATNEKLGSIKRFLDENPLLESIGETLPGIVENNRQLNEGLHIFNEGLKKEFPDLFIKIQQSQAIPAKQSLLAQIIKENEAEILALNFQIEGQENDRLNVQQKIRESDEKIKVYDELIRRCEAYQKLKNLQDFDEQKLKKVNAAFELAKVEEQQVIQKLEIIEKHLEELQARKEREALEARYEDARAMLSPGEACPLCGSTEHPMVAAYENKQSSTNQMLRAKSDEQKIQKLVRERCLRDKTAFEAQITAVAENIGKTKLTMAENMASFEKANENIKFANLSISDKNLLLEGREKIVESLAKLKAVFEVIEKISQIEFLLKGLHYFYTSIQQICRLDETIKTGLLKYQKYLGGITGIGDSLQELGRQQGFNKKAIEQNQALREGKLTFVATISEKEKNIEKLKTDIANLSVLLEKENSGLTEILGIRTEKLGDKDPVKEEKNLENLFHQKEKEEFEIKNNITKKTGELQNIAQMVVRTGEEIMDTVAGILEINQRLSPQLEKLGFQTPEAAEKSLLQPQEAETIIKKLDYFKEEITKAKQSLLDLSAEMANLKSIDNQSIELETLETAYADLSKKVNQFNQEIGAIKKTLQQNDKNLGITVEIRHEKEQQEKEFARWDALNRLIGDAAGKTFAGFAQELTLKFMLVKANLHLKNLTDRYRVTYIKNENVDDLFVIDTYHGDENRSVKTLSGGESFQVSLALALGLSDLAGNKTRIESLFIDEGFGTLDQETLDTALSALEKLQHETNRTIGIISHVEALKDRITTQIELMKDASGNSRLVIKE